MPKRYPLEHPVIGAGAEVHLLYSRLEQALRRLIRLAILADLGRPHVGVTAQRRALKTSTLTLARSFDPRPQILRGLPKPVAAQLS